MTFEIGKLLAASTVAGAMMASAAMAETELRMMWYNDGNEGEVMQSLLDRFEARLPRLHGQHARQLRSERDGRKRPMHAAVLRLHALQGRELLRCRQRR